MKTPQFKVWLLHLALLPVLIFEIVVAKDLSTFSTVGFNFSSLMLENLPFVFIIAYGLIWSLFREESVKTLWAMSFKQKLMKYPVQVVFLNLQVIPIVVGLVS